MEDLIGSIRKHIDERLASPLTSSFVFAWCLWNYKFFVILFSRNSATVTFALIDSVCFPSHWDYLLRGFLLPLISALIYIFLYPYPSKFVYEFWQKSQRDIAQLKLKIEDETPLTIADSRLLREQHREMLKRIQANQDEYDSMVADKDSEIARLKAGMSSSDVFGDSVHLASPSTRIIAPNEREIEAMVAFGRQDESMSVDALSDQLPDLANAQINYLIDELKAGDLITDVGIDKYGRPLFKLTRSGRKFLVENDLVPPVNV